MCCTQQFGFANLISIASSSVSKYPTTVDKVGAHDILQVTLSRRHGMVQRRQTFYVVCLGLPCKLVLEILKKSCNYVVVAPTIICCCGLLILADNTRCCDVQHQHSSFSYSTYSSSDASSFFSSPSSSLWSLLFLTRSHKLLCFQIKKILKPLAFL